MNSHPAVNRKNRRTIAALVILATLVSGGVARAFTFEGSNSFQQLFLYREAAPFETNSTGWVNVHALGIGQAGLYLARFSAESACWGGGASFSGYCSVRVLIGGVEAEPASGVDFAFDSVDFGDETEASWESHSMERSRRVSTAPQIIVQARVNDPSVRFRLDDWHLTVERYS